MPLFVKPYKSEITQFLEQLKAADPKLEQRQRDGRALLWDKQVDRDAQKAARLARVPQKPYVYGTEA
jgi:hypothetical protein